MAGVPFGMLREDESCFIIKFPEKLYPIVLQADILQANMKISIVKKVCWSVGRLACALYTHTNRHIEDDSHVELRIVALLFLHVC